MADTSISGLTGGAAVGATDLLPNVQSVGSGPVKTTAAQLKTFMSASPSLVTPALGTPSSGVLSSCTGYPVAGVTGLGTGVATALAVNVGSAGAPVVFNGALGTPSSGTLSGCTALPLASVTGFGTGVATALAVNTGLTGAITLNNATNTFTVSNTFTGATSSIYLGATGGNLGIMTLFGSTSGSVAVKAAAAAGTGTIFQLPANNGTNTYVLQTDGSGVTSWVAAGAGGTPAGASLTLQYNNASSFGGMTGTSWDDTNRSLTITGATVTTSNPILNLTQVWNDGAVTFTGVNINITKTAAAAASVLFSAQLGGTNVFRIVDQNAGAIFLGSGTDYMRSNSGFMQINGSSGVEMLQGGNGAGTFYSSRTELTADVYIGNADATLKRIASGIVGVRGSASSTGAAFSFLEQTAPSAPSANGVYIYAQDNGGGKTQLMALFSSGVAQQIAIEP
jgi:hypothetical protein